jgi:CspA family cold shock protein
MSTGTIVFIKTIVQYGFIKDDANPELDIFVHMDDVEGPDLVEGERVEFEIENGRRGPFALNVKRLSDAESTMQTGTIVFIKPIIEYGLIRDDDNPELDLSVHRDDVERLALVEGERVEFDPPRSGVTNIERLTDTK